MMLYHQLIKFIPELQNCSFGEWIIDNESDGSTDHPIQMPWVKYSDTVHLFLKEVSNFFLSNDNINLIKRYGTILEKNGILLEGESMSEAEVSDLDGTCILALIFGAINIDRFCEGSLLKFFENGCMMEWLERLRQVDEES